MYTRMARSALHVLIALSLVAASCCSLSQSPRWRRNSTGVPSAPVMGWNAWMDIGVLNGQRGLNETMVRRTAQQFQRLGLDRLGYRYVNLDDVKSRQVTRRERRAAAGSAVVSFWHHCATCLTFSTVLARAAVRRVHRTVCADVLQPAREPWQRGSRRTHVWH